MGITPKDIAAQRAMIARGEAIAAAKNHHAERVRLRDTFAAAAITGLLSHSIAPEQAMSQYIRIAAAYADAMLRERERTNHDAVPSASSVSLGNGGGCGGTDKLVTLPAKGTGNTTLDGAPAVEAGAGKPQISHPQAGNTQTAPPCVETDGPPSQGEGLNIPHSRTRLSEAEIDALEFVVEEGRTASVDDYGILRSLLVRLRPEWESQSYDEGDEKRTNTNTDRDATPSEDSVHGEGTVGMAGIAYQAAENLQGVFKTFDQWSRQTAGVMYRLARHIELLESRLPSDAEREAIALAYSRLTADAKYEEVAATLKALLERVRK